MRLGRGEKLKKNKILIVGPAPPQLGGMEAFIGGLLETDLTSKFRIHLLNISKHHLTKRKKNQEFVGYDTIFKRNIFLSMTSYSYSIIFILKYLFALFSIRPQIVHIHTASYTSFWDKVGYILLAKMCFRKIIVHIHGGFFEKFYVNSNPAARFVIRKTLGFCQQVCVLSDIWFDFFKKIIPEEKITIVPNGINVAPFATSINSKSARPSFLFVGRVGGPKGVYDLLRAAKLIPKKMNCELWFMGNGELDNVKQISADLGLSVKILGPKFGQEKYDIFNRAWCFVLPSHAEGLPITILEAFAAGLPVIATQVGSIPQVVIEGQNGFLFEKQNVNDLAQLMMKIIEDDNGRNLMGRINRDQALEKYDINKSATRISGIYDDLLKN